MPIAIGLLLVAVVAVLVAGPLGLASGTARPSPAPTSSGVAATPSGRSGPTPSAASAESAAPTNVARPSTPATPATPAPIVDVAIVPVTSFRSAATSTTAKELQSVLAGTSGRYTSLELVEGEADAILAALKVDRPAHAGRLHLAGDEVTLAKDLSKDRRRLAFLRADAIGPEVRALTWAGKALFGVDRVKDLGAWLLTAKLPAPAAADATTRRRPGPCSPAATSSSTAVCT